MQTTTTSRTYAIDPAHSEVGFAVRHLMITTIRGNFIGFSGTITLPPTGDIPTNIEGAVDTTTVATREEKRDAHLRGSDFFDTDKFPRISFVSTSITGSGQDFTVVGDLTIRDVTKSVTLKGKAGGTTTDPWGNYRVGLTASGRINRSDFGVSFNAPLESGGVMVSNEVDITIEVSAVQVKEL
jgi:polyisoprenoid-binding protein YceI